MGHERLGLLPKSKKWREIVAKIQPAAENKSAVPELVESTAREIQGRFQNLCRDPAVQDYFTTLLVISVAARAENPRESLTNLGFNLIGEPRPFNLARLLMTESRYETGSPEYAQIARKAAIDAINNFYEDRRRQESLFPEDSFGVWRDASSGAGFCNLAREFFAGLTKGHLSYLLEREASATLPSLQAREEFQRNLNNYIDDLSRHSFETAKITQSFAAGWYNKNAQSGLPSQQKIRAFLRIATRKILSSLNAEEVA